MKKQKNKETRLYAFISAVLCILFLFPAGIVCADVTVPITPKNLPKTDATLTFTYSGEVTGLTVVTPDGRSYSGTPVEAGTISIYIGEAPDGKYMLTIAGSFVTFQVTVSGTAAGTTASTTVAAPTPTPTPPPTPTPKPTDAPTPTPRPTEAPKPTSAPTPTPVPAVASASSSKANPTQSMESTSAPDPTSEDISITPGAAVPKGTGSAEGKTDPSEPDKPEEEKEQKSIPGLLQAIVTDESGTIIEIPLYAYWIAGIFGICIGFFLGYLVIGRKKKKKVIGLVDTEIVFDEKGRIQ